jgi:hypothetical protein
MAGRYLPERLDAAKVLITVKTYPLPSNKYDELVCTAGLLPDGKWIRIYPIPFLALPKGKQFRKYEWIQLDLTRNTSDFRPESYRPAKTAGENIQILESVGTADGWSERRKYVEQNVFESMTEAIELAKGEAGTSLVTLRPREVTRIVVEKDARDWKDQWMEMYDQYDMFNVDADGEARARKQLKKVPYKFSYEFLSKGDMKPRRLMIEDWEIGALYWNCLESVGGDEENAIKLVTQKYFETFVNSKDLMLFLGTTMRFHKVAPNPFIIIGVFYPPTKKDSGQEEMGFV